MTIRFGVIGCGNVCEQKSTPALYKTPGSEVVMVMRRDRALAEDFARRHGIRRFTDDAQAVIEDPEVDAVYVATPPGSHAEYALLVARAGKPCYVEKPMARSAPECRRMLDAFKLAGQPLFVAYYRRALPRFVKLKQLLAEGQLGRVISVDYALRKPLRLETPELPWRLEASKSGGGLFLDLGSHVVDLLHYLFGKSTSVLGHAKNHSRVALVEDTVTGTLCFESGVSASLCCCFAAGSYEDRLEILGDRGQLSCSVFGSEPLLLCNDEGTAEFVTEHPPHIQAPLIQNIVDELHGTEVRSPSRGETALSCSETIDHLLSDYYGGRGDAFWDRPTTWPGLRQPAQLV